MVVPMPIFFCDLLSSLSALNSPLSTEPMPKSPICTGLHAAMRVRKGAGIGGSLVAAPIRLSIP